MSDEQIAQKYFCEREEDACELIGVHTRNDGCLLEGSRVYRLPDGREILVTLTVSEAGAFSKHVLS